MQFESYFFNKAESSGEYCYATAFLLVLLLLYLFRGLLNPILSFCKEQCKYLWFAMLSEESFFLFHLFKPCRASLSSPSILGLSQRIFITAWQCCHSLQLQCASSQLSEQLLRAEALRVWPCLDTLAQLEVRVSF